MTHYRRCGYELYDPPLIVHFYSFAKAINFIHSFGEAVEIIIIIIIRNLYSAIMPLGGYRGAAVLKVDHRSEARRGKHFPLICF